MASVIVFVDAALFALPPPPRIPPLRLLLLLPVFLRGQRDFTKRSAAVSLHEEQTRLLSKVSRATLSMVRGREGLGLSIDKQHAATLRDEKPTTPLLGGANGGAAGGDETNSDADSDDNLDIDGDGDDDGGGDGDGGAPPEEVKDEREPRDFVNGDWTYKMERAVQHFQLLAFIFEVKKNERTKQRKNERRALVATRDHLHKVKK